MTIPTITPVIGTAAPDTLTGSGRSEVFSGLGADDTITAGSGSDTGYGGSGNDTLFGDAGNDTLYGGGGPSYADMANLQIAQDYTGTVTFLGEGAGFRNTLGMYKVDADGTIQSVEILFANASAQGSGGKLIGGTSSVTVDLAQGDRVGFFVLPNGYGYNGSALATGDYVIRDAAGALASLQTAGATTLYRVDPATGVETAVNTQYGTHFFHSAADPATGYALNPDAYPHTVGRVDAATGTVILGFEDLWRGGDKDYDDVVLSFDVGQSNAVVLDPNLSGQGKADDAGWTYGADGHRYAADGTRLADENDTIHGGTGDDRLFGMAGHDRLDGGDGDDEIKGNSGDDRIVGGAGDDTLSGGKGDDTLSGGTGDDRLSGNSGNDTLSGGDGTDRLVGESGDDTLAGDGGDDTLDGGSGDDLLFGGEGNDVLKGGSGDDVLDGGSGSDAMDGGKGADTLLGGGGADKLRGGAGDDLLEGGTGKDYLNGGNGDDVLAGGAGNDRIYLGAGADEAKGGSGDDRFVFRFEDLDGSTDRIGDFRNDATETDRLDLRQLDVLAGGRAAADWIATNVVQSADGSVRVDLGGAELILEARGPGAGSDLYDEVVDAFLFA